MTASNGDRPFEGEKGGEDRDQESLALGRDSIDMLRNGRMPSWLRTGASAGWRFLVIVGVVLVAGMIVIRLRLVLLPMVLALMIAAVLVPPARWLIRHGWPKLPATLAVFASASLIVGGLGWLIFPGLAAGFAEIGPALGQGYQDIKDWLVSGPLDLSAASIDDFEATAVETLSGMARSQAPSRAALMLEAVAALFLTFVVAFFYVKDADFFRAQIARRFPADVRERAMDSMSAGWTVLQRYILAIMIVGAVDATLIGIGLAVIGVPLVFPLVVLTFIAAMFPLVGAIFAGGVATLLALATGGPGDALLVLILTVVVQQIDGDIVAPAIFARAVDLHPLTILLSLAGGAVVGGALGAFLAVPLVAVATAIRASWQTHPESSSSVETVAIARAAARDRYLTR